jgi:pepF/M3 family oligoendopeptidase
MKKWNLDALFKGFDTPEFTSSLEQAETLIEDLNAFVADIVVDHKEPVSKIVAFVEKSETLRTVLLRSYAFCSLTISTDALNEDARKYMNHIQGLFSKTTLAYTKFNKWVPGIDGLEELIQNSQELKDLQYFLESIVEGNKYLLDDEVEVVISKMKQTGSTAWSQLQGELTSTLDVEYDGKVISLSEARNLAFHADPKTRKKGYEAELKAYPKIAPSVAYAMNGVKGEVNLMCELRGHESALDQAVYQSRMKRSTLDALIGAMKDYLPEFHKYLKRKAELLGHKDGLPYYDIFAPIGQSSRSFTEEEAMEFIFENFATFGPELEALAKRAYHEEWIDFTPRKGKRGGAFCSNLHPIKQSRILTNFTGSFSNVITLAHELGHAYHGDQIFKERITNSSYTMPVAETASTFCETIVKNAALKEADKEEKIFILEQSLKGSTQVIVDILSRFIFEANVFDTRKTTPLNETMLNKMMTDAQKEAYGDSLNHDYLMPYAWLNKPHYYRGGLSFYNFPYAFGLLFAKGIYAEFKKQGKPFVSKVNLLLQKTGQMSVEDVASLVGIDLSTKEFWVSSLEVIKEEIDLFLELTK